MERGREMVKEGDGNVERDGDTTHPNDKGTLYLLFDRQGGRGTADDNSHPGEG